MQPKNKQYVTFPARPSSTSMQPGDIRVEKLLEFSRFIQEYEKDLTAGEIQFLDVLVAAHPDAINFFNFLRDEETIKATFKVIDKVDVEKNCAETLELIYEKEKRVGFRVKRWLLGLIGH